jgi:hypothetical protein
MKGLIKWQTQWESTEKGALCRSFIPTVKQRLKMKIPITPECTAIVTGHGKTKSYPHRFKLTDNPMCPCNEGEQSPEHLIYECKILEFQRSSLKQHITASGGIWPTTNSDLVAKYLNAFSRFAKFQQTAIDHTTTFMCTFWVYKVSREECKKLWESVPYVKIY